MNFLKAVLRFISFGVLFSQKKIMNNTELGGKDYPFPPAVYPYRPYAEENESEPPTPTRRIWKIGKILEQPDNLTCNAHAWYQIAQSAPVLRQLPYTPVELYYRALKNEPARKAPSIAGIGNQLKLDGYVENVYYTRSASDVARWILSTSPVMIASYKPFGMHIMNSSIVMMPEPFSEFLMFGEIMKGDGDAHAYVIYGVDLEKLCHDGSKGSAFLVNSFGLSWANGGICEITMGELQKLLDSSTKKFISRACLPVEI